MERKKAYRADLLLARGYPTVDILATRDIVQVWKLGVRQRLRSGLTVVDAR